jgi:hypothetical protein
VILGRGPDHGGAADVDLLDRLLERDAVARDRLDERIEVAADKVNLVQAMALQRFHVLGLVAPSEDAGVHTWVERLDPPVHHLGKTCQVTHRMGVDCSILDRIERAACGVDLVPESRKPAGEGRQATLVANRE